MLNGDCRRAVSRDNRDSRESHTPTGRPSKTRREATQRDGRHLAAVSLVPTRPLRADANSPEHASTPRYLDHRPASESTPRGQLGTARTLHPSLGLPNVDENKELIRRYTQEVFDDGNVDAVDRYLAPDFYNHVTGRSGTEDFKRLAAEFRDASGSANVIDLMVAEGDLVVALMTITRTLHKELRVFAQGTACIRVHLPGDDQSYTVTHVHSYRVVDGKIREHWAVRDDLSMLRQLGAIA
jgi:predicted SnoaL-like aldol condensation-catalyzing enzyme